MSGDGVGYTDAMGENRVNEIVGVFRDGAAAREIARRVTDIGVPTSAVRVDDAGSRVEALKAEMREETDNTFVGPGNVGPFTKEMSKGLVRQTIAWTLALTVLGCLLALFDWPASNLTFPARLAIAAVVGATTGATIGFVWGGGRGAAREPSLHSLAAERGVTVAVAAPSSHASRVVEIMRAASPIRLDVGSPEGTPTETITTEEDARR